MSLFTSLLRVFPNASWELEDFHTEIVAHVLQSMPEETLRWLRDIGATSLPEAEEVIVGTQEDLEALDMHSSGSRPDIAIRLRRDTLRQLIYIESKIGASEGNEQLLRYAEQLQRRTDVQNKTLVYITRDYEPKENPKVDGVIFKQTRWSDFYHYFKALAARGDVLNELLTFMEEHNMSESNQFTTIDLLSLVNFTKARKLMDATLFESVIKKFQQVCGQVSYKESAFTQLKNFRRYVMFTAYGKDRQFEILLGYWLDQDVVTESPWIGVTFHTNPKATQRAAILTAFQNFAKSKSGRWETFDLADDRGWGGMYRGKNLQDFLGEEDHVQAITKYFNEILDDVSQFKKENLKLPWTIEQTEDDKGE